MSSSILPLDSESPAELPVVRVVRRATFSSCHRLHSPHLSAEENRRVYGKCNHEGGHGHNYVVRVTLQGPVDPCTGMVINLVHLKAAMDEAIMAPLDHKNVDKDVAFFAIHPSTVENICIYIWQQLKKHLSLQQKDHLLFEIKVDETENNRAIYRGGENPFQKNGENALKVE